MLAYDGWLTNATSEGWPEFGGSISTGMEKKNNYYIIMVCTNQWRIGYSTCMDKWDNASK